jgi:translocation and assembly module TamB
MRRALAILAVLVLPLAALAQSSETLRDRGLIVGLLEDNLSSAGRAVRIEGFAGALSSRATFTELTIEDDAGTWLTIRDGAISWNRGALLSGRIEIAELSAAEILLARMPQTVPAGTPPEAVPFALPELPVSVSIGKIAADRVELGAALFGAGAVVSLDGSLDLANGEGSTRLAITRIDGQAGTLSLTGAFANATRELSLDLLVDEGPGGIAVNLIGLPDRPAITLAVAGSGPLETFTADIRLSTDGEPRLTGSVALTVPAPYTRGFRAELGGDIAPLLAPAYRDFFGPEVTLQAEGQRNANGGMALSVLKIDAQALRLDGTVQLLASGMPERAALTLTLGLPEAPEVLLPLSGEKTWVRGGTLALGYDRAEGETWSLEGALTGFRRGTFQIEALGLNGSGQIRQAVGAVPEIGGTLTFDAAGIGLEDAAQMLAVGQAASGTAVFSWQQGQPLQISQLSLASGSASLSGALLVSDPGTDLTISGALQIGLSDLARFSGLAGRGLGGRVDGVINGSYTPLSGAFDLETAVIGIDVTLSQPDLDRLLVGGSRIRAKLRRDTEGLALEALDVQAAGLDGQAQGLLRSGYTDLSASLVLADLAVLERGWKGALDASLLLSGADGARQLSLEGTGTGLAAGVEALDRLLTGASTLSLEAHEANDGFALGSLRLSNPQVLADVTETAPGQYDLRAELADVSALAPGFSGPLAVSGTAATEAAGGYATTLSVRGPGGINADVSGHVSAAFDTVDLLLTGSAQAALANTIIAPRSLQGPVEFDLRLNGPPGLSALSGRVTAAGGRFAAPALGIALQDITLSADLADAQAQVSLTAEMVGGGALQVFGPVGLNAPYAADLTLVLNRLHLRDPELFDTRVSGTLAVNGPLAGGARISGALDLAETELRVPSAGAGQLLSIPKITHIAEPADVNATRRRAGLLDAGGGRGGGAAYPLDIAVSAPRQIFVRGRGLDAELGGALHLGGTTADVLPAGQFELIRGRLDILGKRFTLSEGSVQMQGALVPWIHFVATTVQTNATVTVTLEGEATAPTLSFTASPELPEEEVLAQLLFDRGLQNLSPFQAAQLAQAVATLAGTGGEGLISKLRRATGLDDLDVTTSAEGAATLRAGRYLSENIYTDIAIGSDGKTEINLNLDLTPNLTARGTLGSDGNSGIGLYYERDF